MRSSIRTRLTVAFIALAIGPLVLVGVILAWQSFATQQRQALNLQRKMAQQISGQMTSFFNQVEDELRLTGQVQGLLALDRNQQYVILSKLLAHRDVFEELVLLDSQGQEQIRLSRYSVITTLSDRSQAPEFVSPQTNGQTYYGPVRFNETTGEPFMVISVPLFDVRSGQIAGVLVSEVRIKKVWALIAEVQVDPGQSVYIINAQGQVVAHPNPSEVLRGATLRVRDAAGGIQPGLNSSRVVMAVEKVSVGDQEFNVVAEQRVWEALALAINTVQITVMVVVVMLIISATLGFLIVRQIVHPIQEMAVVAQAISAGDLHRQVEAIGQDELGRLAVAFNHMTTRLRQSLESLEERIVQVKHTQESLREANDTLQALFDHSPLAIFTIAPDGRVLFWNKAAETMYGWTSAEVVGTQLPTVPTDKILEHQSIGMRIDMGESVITGMEMERQRKDGSRFFLTASIAPLRDANGHIYAYMCIGMDITERKRTEEALRQSEARYRTLVESQVDLVSQYLPDTTLTFVNDAYCQFFGKTREELIGHSYLFMIAPEYRDLVRQETADLAIHPRPLAGEYVNYRYDGKACWIQWVVRCITDDSGQVVGLQAVGRDITALKQAEAERETLIAELEARNAELERFLYTVSHDLRSPLITMGGFVGFLQKDALSGNMERLEADVAHINDALARMRQLLDELLNLSRIGRITNPSELVPFEAIAREAVALERQRIAARGVHVVIMPDLPTVSGDRARLVEVVQNLVDNACKFMGEQPHPQIEIGARQTGDQTVFYVRDNGMGIDPRYHDQVFGLFDKLDPTSEGVGIGLALVKRIVEVHGGSIWIESEVGAGSTFCFTLAQKG